MISAKDFYNEYIRCVVEEKYWDVYKNTADFTDVIMPIIGELIHTLDESICIQREYFRIDTVGWISHSDEEKYIVKGKETRLVPHVWDLCIAVEHENASALWMDELIKLMHIRCPLKVVIGYNNCDCRDRDFEKLNFAAECMKDVRAYEGNKDEQILVIIGNSAPYRQSSKPYSSFDYRGYVFDFAKQCFLKI